MDEGGYGYGTGPWDVGYDRDFVADWQFDRPANWYDPIGIYYPDRQWSAWHDDNGVVGEMGNLDPRYPFDADHRGSDSFRDRRYRDLQPAGGLFGNYPVGTPYVGLDGRVRDPPDYFAESFGAWAAEADRREMPGAMMGLPPYEYNAFERDINRGGAERRRHRLNQAYDYNYLPHGGDIQGMFAYHNAGHYDDWQNARARFQDAAGRIHDWPISPEDFLAEYYGDSMIHGDGVFFDLDHFDEYDRLFL